MHVGRSRLRKRRGSPSACAQEKADCITNCATASFENGGCGPVVIVPGGVRQGDDVIRIPVGMSGKAAIAFNACIHARESLVVRSGQMSFSRNKAARSPSNLRSMPSTWRHRTRSKARSPSMSTARHTLHYRPASVRPHGANHRCGCIETLDRRPHERRRTRQRREKRRVLRSLLGYDGIPTTT